MLLLLLLVITYAQANLVLDILGVLNNLDFQASVNVAVTALDPQATIAFDVALNTSVNRVGLDVTLNVDRNLTEAELTAQADAIKAAAIANLTVLGLIPEAVTCTFANASSGPPYLGQLLIIDAPTLDDVLQSILTSLPDIRLTIPAEFLLMNPAGVVVCGEPVLEAGVGVTLSLNLTYLRVLTDAEIAEAEAKVKALIAAIQPNPALVTVVISLATGFVYDGLCTIGGSDGGNSTEPEPQPEGPEPEPQPEGPEPEPQPEEPQPEGPEPEPEPEEPQPEPSGEIPNLDAIVLLINGAVARAAISAYTLTLVPPGTCEFGEPVITGSSLSWAINITYGRNLTLEELTINPNLVKDFVAGQLATIGVLTSALTAVPQFGIPEPAYGVLLLIRAAPTAQEIFIKIRDRVLPDLLRDIEQAFAIQWDGTFVFGEPELNDTSVNIAFNATFPAGTLTDEELAELSATIKLALRQYQFNPDLINVNLTLRTGVIYDGLCTITGEAGSEPEPEPSPEPEPGIPTLDNILEFVNGQVLRSAVSAYVALLTPAGNCTFGTPVVNLGKVEWILSVTYSRNLTDAELNTNPFLIQAFVATQIAAIGVVKESLDLIGLFPAPPTYSFQLGIKAALTAQSIFQNIRDKVAPDMLSFAVQDFLNFNPSCVLEFGEPELNDTSVNLEFNVTVEAELTDIEIALLVQKLNIRLIRYQFNPLLIDCSLELDTGDNSTGDNSTGFAYVGACAITGEGGFEPEPEEEPQPEGEEPEPEQPGSPTLEALLEFINGVIARAAISAYALTLNPPGTCAFGEPNITGKSFDWPINVTFLRDLTEEELNETTTLLTDFVADQLVTIGAIKQALKAVPQELTAPVYGLLFVIRSAPTAQDIFELIRDRVEPDALREIEAALALEIDGAVLLFGEPILNGSDVTIAFNLTVTAELTEEAIANIQAEILAALELYQFDTSLIEVNLSLTADLVYDGLCTIFTGEGGDSEEPEPEAPAGPDGDAIIAFLDDTVFRVALSAYALTLSPPAILTFEEPQLEADNGTSLHGARVSWKITAAYGRVLTDGELALNPLYVVIFCADKLASLGLVRDALEAVPVIGAEPPNYDFQIYISLPPTAVQIFTKIRDHGDLFDTMIDDFANDYQPSGTLELQDPVLNGTVVSIAFTATFERVLTPAELSFRLSVIDRVLANYQFNRNLRFCYLALQAGANVSVDVNATSSVYDGVITLFGELGGEVPPEQPQEEPQPGDEEPQPEVPAPVVPPAQAPTPAGPTLEELLGAIANPAVRAALELLASLLVPPCEINNYDEPVTVGITVSWTMELLYERELTIQEKSDGENKLKVKLVEQLKIEDQTTITVEFFKTGTDASKRALQAVTYDAVATISGAAEVLASTLMIVLLFLALFL